MNSSLFNLISRAGSMTLSELRARTSSDPYGLSQELATMLQAGRISLSSFGEASEQNSQIAELTSAKRPASSLGSLAEAIATVLRDDASAETVTVFPTTQGYKSAIS
jgi:predicted transcriptional regulator